MGPFPGTAVAYIESALGAEDGSRLDALRLDTCVTEAANPNAVIATEVLPYTYVPGLYCFDGYTGLTRQLQRSFQIVPGHANEAENRPANYYEFPYDWRLDNRVSAFRLKHLIDRELPRWREHHDYPDAKVILICHSMGGLVARYYVECLGGFEHTRAIVSFGTPYRGSVQVIDYLVNGYRKLGIRLSFFTELMRSFPSIYQLLPIYECVLEADKAGARVWRRAAETTLPKISGPMAEDALKFHREIEQCYEANKGLPEYNLQVVPVVGWGHTTPQAVTYLDGCMSVRTEVPPAVKVSFTDGDGRVPRVSAIPIELHGSPTGWWFWNEKHSTMQNNNTLLRNLAQLLVYLQGGLGRPARGPGTTPEPSSVDLQVDDVYLVGEPISVGVKAAMQHQSNLIVRVEPRKKTLGGECISRRLSGDHLLLNEPLAQGAYRVSAWVESAEQPLATDVFEVV